MVIQHTIPVPQHPPRSCEDACSGRLSQLDILSNICTRSARWENLATRMSLLVVAATAARFVFQSRGPGRAKLRFWGVEGYQERSVYNVFVEPKYMATRVTSASRRGAMSSEMGL